MQQEFQDLGTGQQKRTHPPQLASSIFTLPESADSKLLPYLDNSSCSEAYISINEILDPFWEHQRGAFCLTLRLAGALHTSEKVMDGLLPWLPWMPGKGSYLPGFLEARFPGSPNPWPSPQLPSLKLGLGITFILHLVSFFAHLQPHLRNTFSPQLFHPGTLKGSIGCRKRLSPRFLTLLPWESHVFNLRKYSDPCLLPPHIQ